MPISMLAGNRCTLPNMVRPNPAASDVNGITQKLKYMLASKGVLVDG